jgi:hypothetical protein
MTTHDKQIARLQLRPESTSAGTELPTAQTCRRLISRDVRDSERHRDVDVSHAGHHVMTARHNPGAGSAACPAVAQLASQTCQEQGRQSRKLSRRCLTHSM